MTSISPEARSILKSVELDGAVVVQQKRLLWAIGWYQNRSGAWKDLLDLWVDMGNERASLNAVAVSDKVVLIAKWTDDQELSAVTAWAGE